MKAWWNFIDEHNFTNENTPSDEYIQMEMAFLAGMKSQSGRIGRLASGKRRLEIENEAFRLSEKEAVEIISDLKRRLSKAEKELEAKKADIRMLRGLYDKSKKNADGFKRLFDDVFHIKADEATNELAKKCKRMKCCENCKHRQNENCYCNDRYDFMPKTIESPNKLEWGVRL